NEMLRLLAAYREKEDLIAVGAYQPGSHPVVDAAMRMHEPINALLRPAPDERQPLQASREQVIALAARAAGGSRGVRSGSGCRRGPSCRGGGRRRRQQR